MRAHLLLVLIASALSGACGSDPAEPASNPDGGRGLDGDVPKDCNHQADPTLPEANGCVVDSFALFVDGATGDDTNAGTKDKPYKTIATAISRASTTGKGRIYVCGIGPYVEPLKLTSAVNLVGGFACGRWSYDGSKTKVAPKDRGYALHVDNVGIQITISDFQLVAANVDKTTDGASSIAAFVNNAKVRFLRANLVGGLAAAGTDGAAGTTGALTAVSSGEMNLNGTPATGATGGLFKDCTCSTSSVKSRGGGGGAPTAGGGPGEPSLGAPAPNNGLAGLGSMNCNPAGNGHNGASAANTAASAPPITTLGTLAPDGWRATSGTDATVIGSVGQGGGGGGGRDVTSAGGGGACGGCGGTPGKAGQGGGASIALLANASEVALVASTLSSSVAGVGGKGGVGGLGGAGGVGASGSGSGCNGADGGRGSDGGAGSGGAGGISAAVLYKGNAPKNEGSTFIHGAKGPKGIGGKPASNDGIDGLEGDIVEAP